MFSARTTALGSRSIIFSRVLAAPVGERWPCSHFRNVEALTPNPGGHLKFPHPWPGQIPPVDIDGTALVYAL